MEKGILYCVSTGPGDPELMTIKALKALRQCPVIGVTVSKAGEESLETCAAYQTALQAFPEIRSKEILYLILPMTRDPKVLQECHQRAAEQLAGAGKVRGLSHPGGCIYLRQLYVSGRHGSGKGIFH